MSLVSSGKSQPLSSRGQPALFLTGGICAVLLGLSALNGPLISIRKLDPVTGKVALNNVRAANAEGQNQTFALSSFDANQFVAFYAAFGVDISDSLFCARKFHIAILGNRP